MPPDLHSLIHGWLELESDPGVFTSLVKDFGVNGVELEEIYDLANKMKRPVYGFIFLFRWVEERRNRRKIIDQTDIYVKDDDIINNMFFARQIIPNSCATHALLSILLNSPDIDLGEVLQRIKGYTNGMTPENKGLAIGNIPEIARAHNSHAKPLTGINNTKSKNKTTKFTGDAYHYVSYLPINGNLYELDGLKPFPMNHGPWASNEDWTDKFKKIISDRLSKHNDVRFNLMAVVPDNRLTITRTLSNLRINKIIISEVIQTTSQQQKINNDNNEIKTINTDNDHCVKKEMSPIPSTSNNLNEVEVSI